jgi:hypothetical protein
VTARFPAKRLSFAGRPEDSDAHLVSLDRRCLAYWSFAGAMGGMKGDDPHKDMDMPKQQT